MSVLLIAGTSHALPVVPVPKQKSQSIKIRAQKKYSQVYLFGVQKNRHINWAATGGRLWCDFCPFIMRVRDRVFSVRVFFQFHFYPSLTHCMPLRSFVTCFRLFPVCNKPVIPKYRHVDIHLWIMSAPDQVRILTLTCYIQ